MEKGNMIIDLNNDLVDLPFNNLTADEMGMFLAVCYECQRQKNSLVRIELSELEWLGSYYIYGKLCACVESMFKKLLKFCFVYKDDKHCDFFTIFTRLNIGHENNFIEISVNKPFVSLLNESRLIYMLTELLEHSKLDNDELDLDDIPF